MTEADRENAFPLLCACRKGNTGADGLLSQWSLLVSQPPQLGLAISAAFCVPPVKVTACEVLKKRMHLNRCRKGMRYLNCISTHGEREVAAYKSQG